MSTNKTSDPNKLNAILDAALDLFVEQGFHGTTVPSIADKAGVGAGTIYRYFENKEALVNALYQKWKLKAAESMPTNWQNDQPVREQLKRNMEPFIYLRETASQGICLSRVAPSCFLFGRNQQKHRANY